MTRKKHLDDPLTDEPDHPDRPIPAQDGSPGDLPPETDGQPEGAATAVANGATALAEEQERFLRLAAEYQNYRKRTEREKTESFDRGAASVVIRLLDILDDMERLLASHAEHGASDTHHDGFDMIMRKLMKELESAGLERVDPAGQPFDPTLHEAVAAVAAERPDQAHTVKATFQTGYRFKGAVIRPAKVQVYTDEGVA